jgi:Flp pilus assembly protein TadG
MHSMATVNRGWQQRAGRFAHLRMLRNDAGSTLVEMALLLPLLSLVLAGAADLGRVAYYAMEVSGAASAGAHYGAQSRITAADTAGMKAAAANDAPDVTSVTTLATTVTQSCACSNGIATACATAGSNCTGTTRILEYVQLNTSAVVSPMVRYPGFPAAYTLRGQAIMRVEQ